MGILFYSFAAGWLFDNFGSKSPFTLIGFLDVSYAVGIIISTRNGIFRVHDLKDNK
jgi:F0F1-type ATP synthase assembly protein I